MNTDLKYQLQNNSFFSQFSCESIEQIVKQSQDIELSKNQIIFINEEKALRFYLVTQGWVKLYRETLGGEQSIIDIITNGHVFGETSIFQNDIYPFTAESAEDSKIISFPLSLLKSEIETNPKMAMSMMSSMARYRKQQDQEIENLTLKNAPQRIGCFLLRLAEQNKTGSIIIKLPYDKTLVASRLGMQPETFSRALHKLKEQISIDVKGNEIHIDNVQELINYSCKACSSEYPCQDLNIAN